MAGMFQALEMFPPSPAPKDIDDEDCAHEDTSAPLPAIAQRLYNEKARRVSDPNGAGRLEKRARTAAFIVGFALPPIPDTQRDMLQELSSRVAEETKASGKS